LVQSFSNPAFRPTAVKKKKVLRKARKSDRCNRRGKREPPGTKGTGLRKTIRVGGKPNRKNETAKKDQGVPKRETYSPPPWGEAGNARGTILEKKIGGWYPRPMKGQQRGGWLWAQKGIEGKEERVRGENHNQKNAAKETALSGQSGQREKKPTQKTRKSTLENRERKPGQTNTEKENRERQEKG